MDLKTIYEEHTKTENWRYVDTEYNCEKCSKGKISYNVGSLEKNKSLTLKLTCRDKTCDFYLYVKVEDME